MATEPAFTPEFGPNGAVMNAPTMTPEMRERIEQSVHLPTKARLRSASVWIVSPSTLFVFAVLMSPSMDKAMKSSSWFSGACTGAMAVIVALQFRRAFDRSLQRWELKASQRQHRGLVLPEWGRWLFVLANTLVPSVFAAAAAVLLLDVHRQVFVVTATTTIVGGGFAIFGFALRWYADRRGWQWRANAPRAATPAS